MGGLISDIWTDWPLWNPDMLGPQLRMAARFWNFLLGIPRAFWIYREIGRLTADEAKKKLISDTLPTVDGTA